MGKIKILIYSSILLTFFFLHLHYGLRTENDTKDNIKLKIKYKSQSKDIIQISYYQPWEFILPSETLPININRSGIWKEVEVDLPKKYSFTNLLFNFGRFDSTDIHLIKFIELDISGTKIRFTKSSLMKIIKNNNDFRLNSDGEIIYINKTLAKDYIIKTHDLSPFIAKYESSGKRNTLFNILLSVILTIISFLLLYFLKWLKTNTFLENIIRFNKINNVIKFSIIFLLINIFAIIFYSINKVDYLIELKTNDSIYNNKILNKKYEIFNKINHNPKNNLLYNGNFKYNLMFWTVYADSTFVSLIDTPYGKGVRIKRTDGDGGYWPFKYAGRPSYFSF